MKIASRKSGKLVNRVRSRSSRSSVLSSARSIVKEKPLGKPTTMKSRNSAALRSHVAGPPEEKKIDVAVVEDEFEVESPEVAAELGASPSTPPVAKEEARPKDREIEES